MNDERSEKVRESPTPARDAVDVKTCSHCGPTPQPTTRRPQKHTGRGLGYFVLFVIAAALFATNSSFLRAMAKDVSTQKRTAEEAERPAEVETVAILSTDCSTCYNIAALFANLGSNKTVKITNTRTLDVNSAEGAAIVNQYQLTRSPAFIIRGQTQKLLASVPGLKSFGQIQNDVFVGSNVPAPYMELGTKKLRGMFTATYLTEKNCKECYDPTINRQALAQFGMKPDTEKTIDRTDPEGEKLIKQYSITSTPTMILTGDMSAYPGFDSAWKTVGTIEGDGAHVFRSGQSQMGTYYDLTAKKVVVPPTNTNTAKP